MEQIIINQNDNQLINLHSNEPQLITLSNVNPQDININLSDVQEIGIKNKKSQILYVEGSGNVVGITDVLVNGVSVVSEGIAYIIVPTKTSELINDSNFITSESDPTVPSYIKSISLADINSWNNKQNLLVSGSNIKTINGNSLLGSGNINIGGANYTAGYGINIDSENVIDNTITSYNDLTDLPTIPTATSELTNDSNFVTSNDLSQVAFDGSYTSLSNLPDIPVDTSDLNNDSGFITKDVNDLTYYTLTSNLSTVATSGNYSDLSGTPTIPTVNDGTLTIQKNGTTIDTFTANSSSNKTINITTPTNTSDLNNDSGYITLSNLGWTDKTSDITVNNANINTNRTRLFVNEGLRLVFLEVYYGAVMSSTVSKPIQFPLDYKPAFFTSDQLWFVMGGSNGGTGTCRGTVKWNSTETYVDLFSSSTTVNYPFGVIMYPY